MKTNRKEFVLLSVISAIFLTFSIMNLKHVGVGLDESLCGRWGVDFLRNKDIQSASPVKLHPIEISFLGKRFPVNHITSYAFSGIDYMLIPFFLIFGINIMSIKFTSIFAAWLTLLMLYYVLRNLFNRKIAIITNILLVVSPLFIHYARIGIDAGEPLLNFFFIGSVFFYLLHVKKKSNFYLCIAALFFGFGFSVFLSFFSRLIGLVVAGIIIFPKKLLNFNRALNIKQLTLIAVFFATGSFLFIYGNIVSKGESFKLVRCLYTYEPGDEINNLDFPSNFKVRVGHLASLIKERIGENFPYPEMVKHAPLIINRNVLLWVFELTFALNLMFLLFRGKAGDHKKVLFIYVLYITMFFTSCFSPGSMRKLHLALLHPFPQFMVALFIDNFNNLVKGMSISRIFKKALNSFVYILALMPLIIINVNILLGYHSVYRNTGGYAMWSGYICDVADHIKKIDIHPIFLLNWGLNPVHFITLGEMDFNYDLMNDPGHIPPEENFIKRLKPVLKKNKIAYFISMSGYDDIKIEWIKEEAKKSNKKLVLIKTFFNKINEPVYMIHKVEQKES